MTKKQEIQIFENKKVRTAWDSETEQWYFSIVDIVAILTESVDPQAYWRKLKQRLKNEGNETVTTCHALKMISADGKMRLTDVANQEQMFRLIQSIPSPKAEPFKIWMAQVASQRLDQMQDPELSIEQAIADYKRLGYSDKWINSRVKGIEVRKELTDEWERAGVKQGQDFAYVDSLITGHTTTFVQMPSAQIEECSVPAVLCLTTFSNHTEILNRCEDIEERIFYMLYSAHQHLTYKELRRCIVNQTFEALMKTDKQMTPVLLEQYPGAEYMLKDRVLLDFLNLKEKHTESQLHGKLVEQMKQFVLELGKDFLYIDDEYTVMVGGKRKRIDLVFYHRALQCLVAIELKSVDFESEFVSKMDMYLEALDRDYKLPNENPSVGIILCPSADKAEVEYSLCRSMSPTMVAEYRRILIPREVMTKSLQEYCEFLKTQYK